MGPIREVCVSVYQVPSNKNWAIPIGDDWVGVQLGVGDTPGVGTYFVSIIDCSGAKHDFVVVEVTAVPPAAVSLDVTSPSEVTETIEPGDFVWSLLFREDGSDDDRTMGAGAGKATAYPTSTLEP